MGNHKAFSYGPLGTGMATITATVAGYPDWRVAAVVIPTTAGPVIRSITVRPFRSDETHAPAGGVPSRLVRKINVGELLDLARSQALAGARARADAGGAVAAAWGAAADQLSQPVKRPGRKGNGVDHYLKWAVRYVEKVDAGERHPIPALAKDHGMTTTYIRDTITDARRRHGLLTRPGQGRAGGQLTDKARALIAQHLDQQEAKP